jgi:hypothetical protein
MKTIAKIASVLVTVALTQVVANAQIDKKDPSYSTSNYKNPYKAAYAKKMQDNQPVVYIEEVKEIDENSEKNALTASSNYKAVTPSKAKIKRFKIADKSVTRSSRVYAPVPSNYKMPYSAPRKQKVEKVEMQPEPVVKN